MLSDSLFRAFDVNLRKRMVKLVEKTKKSGATVHIFSSLHPRQGFRILDENFFEIFFRKILKPDQSGIQLSNLTGLAAILRYPLPEIDEIEMTDSE